MIYDIRYVDVAKRQRDALPRTARAAFDSTVTALRRAPYEFAQKGRDGIWWRDFGSGGQIMYLISDHIITITVLRVTHL
ncbi:hypothetical protein [Streptomyces hainanensis]|uniref:Type II toxin-antitoxin system RelE/ParE family toxin n=1 Tax=Streptomyces hainanensis TaxID=402648 RepID=A0A4R4S903_9ACTN|nr:hypothetical protein [Streptomyces hainanensis]TDC59510.1 hypothetical protein E1283_36620 [Streptomyces hainanensis]